jgi:hypothetical protein
MSVNLSTSQCSTHQTLGRIVLYRVATARARLPAMVPAVVSVRCPCDGRMTVSTSMSERVALHTDVLVRSVADAIAQCAVEHVPRAVDATVTELSTVRALVLCGGVGHCVTRIVAQSAGGTRAVDATVTELSTVRALVLCGGVGHCVTRVVAQSAGGTGGSHCTV